MESLLAWYDRERRILPWREDPTPYHVWISEIMLQQTRVEAVKGYYLRFLEELPGIPDLASAEEDRLLKLWEGLGYYSRARNLKKAAQQIMEEYGGEMPSDAASLRKLPGIGPYTSAAIASIAFGENVPAVDGNLLRIFARMTGYSGDIRTDEAKKEAEKWYRSAFSPVRPGDCNQALMDLGAAVCLPNGAPACGKCPWKDGCSAHRTGQETLFPAAVPKKPRRREDRTVFLLRRGEGKDRKYALRKRPRKGLLAGLCEFPNAEGRLGGAEAAEWVRDMGFEPLEIVPAGDAKHVFTHIEWHMTGYLVDIAPAAESGVPGASGEIDAAGTAAPENSLFFAGTEDLTERWSLPSAFSAYLKYILRHS